MKENEQHQAPVDPESVYIRMSELLTKITNGELTHGEAKQELRELNAIIKEWEELKTRNEKLTEEGSKKSLKA
jgi:hypothetical protein